MTCDRAAEVSGVSLSREIREVRERASVRTAVLKPEWLDRALLYDVNFNCHAEHHAHPQIPSCHLPAVRRALGMEEGPASMFGTLRHIYARRKASRV